MKPTAEQTAIIESDAADMLIVAGAGTGKTTTLCAYLQTQAARLGRTDGIVVITYTNQAAEHLLRKLGPSFQPRFCGTLHAWALRELCAATGKAWAVIDEPTALDALAECKAALRYNGTNIEVTRAIANESITTSAGLVAKAYRERLLAADCLDFDLILWKFRELLRSGSGPELDLLAVDEYQDTAPIDAEIYGLVRTQKRFVVGDPDQCIYGFRGAAIENILQLAETTAVFPLTTNWRSTPEICDRANCLIAHNVQRLEKYLTAGKADLFGTITTPTPYENEATEAVAIAAEARSSAALGHSVGILARTNAAVDLLRAAIPEAEAETQPPIERAILLSALNAIVTPTNTTAAATWLRHFAAATPRFSASAAAHGSPPLDYALRLCKTGGAAPTIARLRAMKVPQTAIGWAVSMGVRLASQPRIALLDMVQAMQSAATCQATKASKIEIMTMHGAKGREFDHVFIAAAEQEITPGQKRDDELEEERRLFFVAFTRARRFVTITSAASRRDAFTRQNQQHQPTRFIRELAL